MYKMSLQTAIKLADLQRIMAKSLRLMTGRAKIPLTDRKAGLLLSPLIVLAFSLSDEYDVINLKHTLPG